MDLSDLLLRWTIRLSLGLYVVVLAAWLRRPTTPRWIAAMRGAWTLGWLLALMHTALAFHFVHAWSHAAALDATARQTEQLLGVAYGGGVYWNYAFVAVWGLDAVWWWLSPRRYLHRPWWLGLIVHGFLGFMAFNGAVVFAAGPIRWVGIAACLGLVLIAVWPQPATSAQDAPPDRDRPAERAGRARNS